MLNGVCAVTRLNRYAQKRKHIREQEKKYARKYYGGDNVKALRRKLEDEAAEDNYWNRKHPPRNGGWEYWHHWYITGRRQFAKKYSDKTIRQKYRQIIRKLDPEDVTAPHGADYEKEYDYNWTIW